MQNIYISSEQPHLRYEPALDFGDRLISVTGGNWSSVPNSKSNSQVLSDISETLAHFKQDDYLLISGSPIIVGLCMVHLSRRYKHINCLLWDKVSNGYNSAAVQLSWEDSNNG